MLSAPFIASECLGLAAIGFNLENTCPRIPFHGTA